MAGIEALYDNLVTVKGYMAVLDLYAKAIKAGEYDDAKRFLGILKRSEFSGRLKRDIRKLGL
jgi:hypothetical protein